MIEHRTDLPRGYTLCGRLDLLQDRRLQTLLLLAGVALLMLSSWLGYWLVTWARPDLAAAGLGLGGLVASGPGGGWQLTLPVLWLVGALLAMPVVVVLHEGLHVLCFWLLTRRWPRFGVAWLGPYVALPPGVTLGRNAYLVVILAPLVVLTAASALLLGVLPLVLVPALLCGAVFNAAGAVGDLQLAAWLLRFSRTALVADVDSATVVYCRSPRVSSDGEPGE